MVIHASVPMLATKAITDETRARVFRSKATAPIRKRWQNIMLSLQPGDTVGIGKHEFVVTETVRIQARGTQAFVRDDNGKRRFFGWEHLAACEEDVYVTFAPKFKSK